MIFKKIIFDFQSQKKIIYPDEEFDEESELWAQFNLEESETLSAAR